MLILAETPTDYCIQLYNHWVFLTHTLVMISSLPASSKSTWTACQLPPLSCCVIYKGKGKIHPRTGYEGPEGEYRYSSALSLASALDGVGGQRHAPAALPEGKTRYPSYRRLCGPQGRSGRVQKISPSPGFDPPTVQPVAGRYTNWAIPAPANVRGKT